MSETRYVDPEFRKRINAQRCPICNSIEGCDHTFSERIRAYEDTDYCDQMRADDPLLQVSRARHQMTGFLSTLTPEQRTSALQGYEGDDTIGDRSKL